MRTMRFRMPQRTPRRHKDRGDYGQSLKRFLGHQEGSLYLALHDVQRVLGTVRTEGGSIRGANRAQELER